ncbi:hypothetical protein [Aquipuribacter sp. MA13-6]|uniref:hypothetical protein n=1 Tax=unclassified Aquipuribacter TaxID=2635084 RepID=UPI003EEC8D97
MDGHDAGLDGPVVLGGSFDEQAIPGLGPSPPAQPDGKDSEATVVLAQVRWLLQDTAEQVRLQAQAEGLSSAGHPLALGAELAACEAANLMAQPPVDDYGPEHVPAGALDTLAAAEVLARSLAIDAFPAGMSGLVIRICDLLAEATVLRGVDQAGPFGRRP